MSNLKVLNLHRKKKVIFFVDDEQGIIDLTKEELEELGFEVHSFNCYLKAREKEQELRPDLIFLDYKFGENSILKLAKEKDFQDVPKLFISGWLNYAEMGKLNNFFDGVIGFLSKPFSIDTVLFIAKQHLSLGLSGIQLEASLLHFPSFVGVGTVERSTLDVQEKLTLSPKKVTS